MLVQTPMTTPTLLRPRPIPPILERRLILANHILMIIQYQLRQLFILNSLLFEHSLWILLYNKNRLLLIKAVVAILLVVHISLLSPLPLNRLIYLFVKNLIVKLSVVNLIVLIQFSSIDHFHKLCHEFLGVRPAVSGVSRLNMLFYSIPVFAIDF